jgi:hypothetical protein
MSPFAGPDGRALVSGWSALILKDRRTGQCYVALKNVEAIAMEAAGCAR